MRTASLPMYNLPEMAPANAAFWAALRDRLSAKGVNAAEIAFDTGRQPVPDGIGPEVFFTQICGYPLFKRFRDRGRLVGTPCYSMPGCTGDWHRAYFMVRAHDDAAALDDLRGRVFGCNSRLSNTGMNLPRCRLRASPAARGSSRQWR